MRAPYRRSLSVSIALIFLCTGCTSVAPENFLSLFVGVRIDSTTFRSDGYVVLELVPTDQHGETFVSEDWHITVGVKEPSTAQVTTDTTWVQPADPRPLAAVILVDDSGSILRNDPNRERARAAELFAEQFLAANPQNRVALADFGWPAASATSGFVRTRLLQDFTADLTQFRAGTAQIQGIEGGGSRVYQSALEVARWIGTTISPTYKRSVIIITDGFPTQSDVAYREELFAEAAAQEIRILGVGVGSASDQSGESVDSAVAVVRELASRTGGVYSGTTSSTQLVPVLTALANVSTQSQLLMLLRLNPPPPPGTALAGKVAIEGARGAAAAHWTAVAP